jgi:hypothetical protein
VRIPFFCCSFFEQKKAGHGGAHLSSQQWWEAKSRMIVVQADLWIKQHTLSKIKSKRAGSVAQMVEHMPRNYKALRSHPNTAQRKKIIIIRTI